MNLNQVEVSVDAFFLSCFSSGQTVGNAPSSCLSHKVGQPAWGGERGSEPNWGVIGRMLLPPCLVGITVTPASAGAQSHGQLCASFWPLDTVPTAVFSSPRVSTVKATFLPAAHCAARLAHCPFSSWLWGSNSKGL